MALIVKIHFLSHFLPIFTQNGNFWKNVNFRPRSGPKSGINDPFFEIIAFSDRKDVTSAGLMVLIFKIHFWSILGPFFAQKWPNLAQNGPFWAIFWRSGLEIGKNDRFSEKIVLNNS